MFISCVGYLVLNSNIWKKAASSEGLRNMWQQIHIQHLTGGTEKNHINFHSALALWYWALTCVCTEVIPSRVTVQLFAEWHCKFAFTQFKDSKKYKLMLSLDKLLELLVMIKFQTHSENFPWIYINSMKILNVIWLLHCRSTELWKG